MIVQVSPLVYPIDIRYNDLYTKIHSKHSISGAFPHGNLDLGANLGKKHR